VRHAADRCGKVFLPEGTLWVNDVMGEFAAFSMGAHDDCVDSLTQALNHLRRKPVDSVAWWPVRLYNET
jgi:predicted phage terminase large subunit-like protein